jgi:hypothetical protein
MAKYTLNCINKRENDKLIQFNIELPYLVTVIEAIKDVIPLINQKLTDEKSNWRLTEDARYFELYKSKKTGHPKTDYPGNTSTLFSSFSIGFSPNTPPDRNQPDFSGRDRH